MTRQHCTYIDPKTGARRTWFTDRRWTLANDLPRKSVSIGGIADFDQNTWFGQTEPTCRHVAVHARRIYEVMHRICKAFILGLETIDAVLFLSTRSPTNVWWGTNEHHLERI